jgi:hypothetical protein
MLPLRRHDPPETILAQNQIRVPELVPIRHQRMAASWEQALALMMGRTRYWRVRKVT